LFLPNTPILHYSIVIILMRKRFAIVGCGYRSLYMYGQALTGRFADTHDLVALIETNPLRAKVYAELAKYIGPIETDLKTAIQKHRPDTVVVTTPDHLHDVMAVTALENGCDVICEKPMATDLAKCRRMLEAEKRTGRKITITFNYRFSPHCTYVRRLLRDGVIGEPLSVDYNWLLDRSHGADYFRRWHRRKANSGGLLIHKATHHFDMVNWLLGQKPQLVFAQGALEFYGKSGPFRGQRCRDCEHRTQCELVFRPETDPMIQKLYFDNESADGYYRDRCVFDPEIDIEDTMSLSVRYDGGAYMTYSLNAHCAYEAALLRINGTKGRIEFDEYFSGDLAQDGDRMIRVFDNKGKLTEHRSKKPTGGHGGADPLLQDRLFGPPQPDPLNLVADAKAGALSLLVGLAANQSIATGQPVRTAELLPDVVGS
jgi:predicted dehydrogenase